MQNRFITLLLSVISCVVVFGQAPAPAKPAASKTAPKTGVAKAPANPLALTPAQSAKLLKPESFKLSAPPEYKVKFTTLKDQSFVIDVHKDWAPLGADRFYNLVKSGFFVGVRFYRVVSGFVVQFGVNPDPKVTAAWSGAPIKDEPQKQSNTKGRLTFAKGGPDSRTTQLFINYGDNSRLDTMGFAPIGEVTEGMDIVEGLFSAYGEMPPRGAGPDQMRLMQEGEKYLKESFPNLDTIKSAVVTFPLAAPAPAAKKAAPKAAAAAPKTAPAQKK